LFYYQDGKVDYYGFGMDSNCASCPVRKASFCRAIPDRDLEAFSKKRGVIEFQRRQTIIVEREPAIYFFNVISGLVKLLRSLPNGRIQIVGFRQPGEFFGSTVGETYTASAEAITCSTICRFSRSGLEHELRASPRLQTRVLHMSFKQLSASQDQVLILGCMTAREKVAHFLMDYTCRSFRDNNRPQRWTKLPMNRSEIADFLGLTVETVSRTLSSLANEEIITVGRTSHSIQVINPDKLAHAAGASC
jgi:CRP/FNR family transcriptional regulator